jgi:hypothetical protein
VDSKCGRRFYADTNATTRIYQPTHYTLVQIDDAWDVTAVKTDEADDGTYSTTWSASDYQELPHNSIGQNGRTGWPTTAIEATDTRWFPTRNARPSVQVTAKWGWTAVPDEVVQATLYYAQRLMYLVDTPGGSTISSEFGSLPIRRLSDIESLLQPYMTGRAGDGRFLVA